MNFSRVALAILFSASLSAQNNPLSLHFTADSNSLYAVGRWVPTDPKEKSPFPSETEIDCNRQTKTCIEATAEFYSGHPHISITHFEVLKWDGNGIVASSSSGICMTQTVLVSFPDKSISNTHSIKKLNREKLEACRAIGASEASTDLFVVKNSQRWIEDPYGESAKQY